MTAGRTQPHSHTRPHSRTHPSRSPAAKAARAGTHVADPANTAPPPTTTASIPAGIDTPAVPRVIPLAYVVSTAAANTSPRAKRGAPSLPVIPTGSW